MIIVAICLLLAGTASFISFREDYTALGWNFCEWIAVIFLFPLSLLLGAIIGFAFSLALPAQMEPHTVSNKIELLNDSGSVSGQFFLGTGSVDGEMKYILYVESEEGYFEMWQLDYDEVRVKYDDVAPFIETISQKPTDSWVNYFATDMCDEEYLIHVPRGTIKKGYNLDGK